MPGMVIMKNGSVSVIVPCYNAEEWLCETLDSVNAQEIGHDEMEIIVVDDGSTDNSAAIVKDKYPRVHLITTENRGPSAARNTGTRESSGEFLQYLDADDILPPGKVKRQLAVIGKDGRNIDIVYGDWRKIRENGDGIWEKKEIIKQTLNDPEIDIFTDFWCPTTAYLFRRSIVNKAGGWDATLKVVDDPYFMMKCVFQGAQFEYSPGIAAYYRVHTAGSVSTRDHSVFISEVFRNAERVEKAWAGTGGITGKRKKALMKVYGQVARASYEENKELFDRAYSKLETFAPGYIPAGPAHLRYVSKLVGYRKAEAFALGYRKMKGLFFRDTG